MQPHGLDGRLRRAAGRVERFAWAAVCLSILGLLVLVGVQIVGRDFELPVIVYDELVALLFVWLIFIGAGLLSSSNQHIRVDLVEGWIRRLGRRWLTGYRAAMALLGAAFGSVFLYSSYALFQTALRRTSPMLAWPQDLWYAALVVGAAVIVGAEVTRFVRSALGDGGSGD